MTKREFAQLLVDRLNDMMLYDPVALHKLCETRVPCNKALIDHPTVQVLDGEDGLPLRVGMLGVLNGLVGTRSTGGGFIAGIYDDGGQLQEFKVLDEAEVKPKG